MTTRNGWWRCAAALATLLGAVPTARADGGYFEEVEMEGQLLSGGQKAVMLWQNHVETLVVQTEYVGDLGAFAWLIPTPSAVGLEDVAEADGALFHWLDDITAPTFISYHLSGGGYDTGLPPGGCSCPFPAGTAAPDAAAGDDDRADLGNSTRVVDTFATESYAIQVLSSESGADLTVWLADNGYAVPDGAVDTFDYYIGYGWSFLAVQIRPAAGAERGDESAFAPPPLRISFHSEIPVYPLRISQLSSAEEADLLMLMVAGDRWDADGLLNEDVLTMLSSCPPLTASGFETEYRACLRDAVVAHEGRYVVVEGARFLDGHEVDELNDFVSGLILDPAAEHFITRLHTVYVPAMYTEDLVFTRAAFNDTIDNEIEVEEDSVARRRAVPLGGAGVLALALGFLVVRRVGA